MDIIKIKSPYKKKLEELLLYLDQPFSAYFNKRIFEKYASNPHCTLYIAKEKNAIMALAFLTFLDWDSDIFGFKIGRIENVLMKMSNPLGYKFLNEIVDDCMKEHYVHISCRTGLKDFETIHILEKLGFNIFDIQITLSTPEGFGNTTIESSREFIIREALEKDLVQLKEVVKDSFTDTRFVVDQKFPRNGVNKLYFEWIKNSILNPKQSVLVVQDKKSKLLTAFSIASFDPDSEETLGIKIGALDLMAVSEKHRNQGIGRMFTRFVINWFKEKVDKVETRTQISNIAAARALMRGGFTEFSSGIMHPAGITMHRWF